MAFLINLLSDDGSSDEITTKPFLVRIVGVRRHFAELILAPGYIELNLLKNSFSNFNDMVFLPSGLNKEQCGRDCLVRFANLGTAIKPVDCRLSK